MIGFGGPWLDESEMRRRSSMTLLSGATSWAATADAQQAAKVARIGWMPAAMRALPTPK